jgi:hypothetical protein
MGHVAKTFASPSQYTSTNASESPSPYYPIRRNRRIAINYNITEKYVLLSDIFARVQIHITYNYMDQNNAAHIFGVVNVHLLHYYLRFGGTHCLYLQGAAV